jgi:outer membrane scaffolding protein for murein synthesis (MipA/OmpV family)
MNNNQFTLILAITLTLMPSMVFAENNQTQKQLQPDWQWEAGFGAIYKPAFFGSKDYQLSAIPNLGVKYKDKFFSSIFDGIGYNVINSNGWKVGPIAKYDFGREEDGESSLAISGKDTTALRGLGDVDGTFEVGGFAEYTWNKWSAKVEVRQGVGGHEGLIGDLSANYMVDIHPVFYTEGRSIFLSIGPHATIVSSDYNEAYYGVNSVQSARSGLSMYKADGGLLSYGLKATVMVPVNDSISTMFFVGYERVAGDAADSPLVQERGSENQAMAGLFVTFAFGY